MFIHFSLGVSRDFCFPFFDVPGFLKIYFNLKESCAHSGNSFVHLDIFWHIISCFGCSQAIYPCFYFKEINFKSFLNYILLQIFSDRYTPLLFSEKIISNCILIITGVFEDMYYIYIPLF